MKAALITMVIAVLVFAFVRDALDPLSGPLFPIL
jgi:hypothetical protein